MIVLKKHSSGVQGVYEQWHRLWSRLFMGVEAHWNRVFGEQNNPLYFLGSLTIFNLLVLTVTGIYMFIYYSPNVETVYESVRYVNNEAFLGELTRSVHQYSSDLMIVLIVLHMIRVFVQDKYRKFRWIAWVSGLVMLFSTLLEGVTGHIMSWNSRSQFVVMESARFLAELKVFGQDLPRAFASEALLSTWIMWILLAIHILIPIAFIFLLYIHFSRITRPKMLPPRALMYGTLVFLVGFSLLFPVQLLQKADLMSLPIIEEVDWFYLFFIPLLPETPPAFILSGTAFVMFFLFGAPWYRKKLAVDVADRDLSSCTGCAACAKDCPYEAIYVRPRTDGQKFKMESVIIQDRCAGCGICVGSCNFGGMNLTDLRLTTIESRMKALLTKTESRQPAPYLGVFCENTVTDTVHFDLSKQTLREDSRLSVFSVPCAGIVGPAFIKKAVQMGAEGVVIAACRLRDCHYREGNIWLKERLRAKRVPKIRLKDTSKPVAVFSFNSSESRDFVSTVSQQLDEWENNRNLPSSRGQFIALRSGKRWASAAALVLISGLFLFGFSWGVLDPWANYNPPPTALLRVNFFHLSEQVSCDLNNLESSVAKIRSKIDDVTRGDNIPKEGQQQQISTNLVSSMLCPRERVPVRLKLTMDDTLLLEKEFSPAGFSNDGLTYVNYELNVFPGKHSLALNIVDSLKEERQSGIDFKTEVILKDRQVLFIDFDDKLSQFYIRK